MFLKKSLHVWLELTSSVAYLQKCVVGRRWDLKLRRVTNTVTLPQPYHQQHLLHTHYYSYILDLSLMRYYNKIHRFVHRISAYLLRDPRSWWSALYILLDADLLGTIQLQRNETPLYSLSWPNWGHFSTQKHTWFWTAMSYLQEAYNSQNQKEVYQNHTPRHETWTWRIWS